MPQAYEGNVYGLAGMLSDLVRRGALALTDSAASIDDLLHQGMAALLPPGLALYEDNWGEYVNIQLGSDGFYCDVWQDCHGWRMRLKPIVTALPPIEAVRFIRALNRSQVQGPTWWDEIVGTGSDATIEQDDGIARSPPAGDARAWLADLFARFPCLVEKERHIVGGTLIEQLVMKEIDEHPHPVQPPPELTERIEWFIETAECAHCYADEAALMVTTWDKDCHVNHGHDYIFNGIHNDGWDSQCQVAFHAEAQTVDELADAMAIIGQFVAVAQAWRMWWSPSGRRSVFIGYDGKTPTVLKSWVPSLVWCAHRTRPTCHLWAYDGDTTPTPQTDMYCPQFGPVGNLNHIFAHNATICVGSMKLGDHSPDSWEKAFWESRFKEPGNLKRNKPYACQKVFRKIGPLSSLLPRGEAAD